MNSTHPRLSDERQERGESVVWQSSAHSSCASKPNRSGVHYVTRLSSRFFWSSILIQRRRSPSRSLAFELHSKPVPDQCTQSSPLPPHRLAQLRIEGCRCFAARGRTICRRLVLSKNGQACEAERARREDVSRTLPRLTRAQHCKKPHPASMRYVLNRRRLARLRVRL